MTTTVDIAPAGSMLAVVIAGLAARHPTRAVSLDTARHTLTITVTELPHLQVWQSHLTGCGAVAHDCDVQVSRSLWTHVCHLTWQGWAVDLRHDRLPEPTTPVSTILAEALGQPRPADGEAS